MPSKRRLLIHDPYTPESVKVNFGFKSKHKRQVPMRSLQYPANQVIVPTAPINSFPLKDNKKRYSLKSVFAPSTYFIDYMFENGLIYLICIGANSRYCSAVLSNSDLNTNPLQMERSLLRIPAGM